MATITTSFHTVGGQIRGQTASAVYPNIVNLTDSIGNVTQTIWVPVGVSNGRTRYSGYGAKPFVANAFAGIVSGFIGSFGPRRTGRLYSEVYADARHFSVSSSRWTTADAYLNQKRFLYNYGASNPIKFIDFNGMQATTTQDGVTKPIWRPNPGETSNYPRPASRNLPGQIPEAESDDDGLPSASRIVSTCLKAEGVVALAFYPTFSGHRGVGTVAYSLPQDLQQGNSRIERDRKRCDQLYKRYKGVCLQANEGSPCLGLRGTQGQILQCAEKRLNFALKCLSDGAGGKDAGNAHEMCVHIGNACRAYFAAGNCTPSSGNSEFPFVSTQNMRSYCNRVGAACVQSGAITENQRNGSFPGKKSRWQ